MSSPMPSNVDKPAKLTELWGAAFGGIADTRKNEQWLSQAYIENAARFAKDVSDFVAGFSGYFVEVRKPEDDTRADKVDAVDSLRSSLEREVQKFQNLQRAYSSDNISQAGPVCSKILKVLINVDGGLRKIKESDDSADIAIAKLEGLLHRHRSVVSETIDRETDYNLHISQKKWFKDFYRVPDVAPQEIVTETYRAIPSWVRKPSALASLALSAMSIWTIADGFNGRAEWNRVNDAYNNALQMQKESSAILQKAVSSTSRPARTDKFMKDVTPSLLAGNVDARQLKELAELVEKNSGAETAAEFGKNYAAYVKGLQGDNVKSLREEKGAYEAASLILDKAAASAYPADASETYVSKYLDADGDLNLDPGLIAQAKAFIQQYAGRGEAEKFISKAESARRYASQSAALQAREESVSIQAVSLEKQAAEARKKFEEARDSNKQTEVDKAPSLEARADELDAKVQAEKGKSESLIEEYQKTDSQADELKNEAKGILTAAATAAFPEDAAAAFARKFKDERNGRFRDVSAATAFILEHGGKNAARNFAEDASYADRDSRYFAAISILLEAVTKSYPDINVDKFVGDYKGGHPDLAVDFVKETLGQQPAKDFASYLGHINPMPPAPADPEGPGHKTQIFFGIMMGAGAYVAGVHANENRRKALKPG